MKRFIAVSLCLLAFLMPSNAALDGGLKVEPVKQLRKGVDAWPLIVNPGNAAEQRVNATLTRLNLRLTQALHNCDAGALESIKQTGDAAGPRDKVSEDWSRKVVVTMQGPRFLSLVATDEYVNCGGAHPDSDTMAMVFDMTTGTPVSWPAMVTKSAGAAAILGAVSDGSKVGALVLPALAKINLAAANEDCRDAFQDPQPFQLWPDAKSGTLVAQAFDLPHVVAACAIEIPLSMAQARALGFDEGLLGAIEQAHRESGQSH
jgi:hypothetical protein